MVDAIASWQFGPTWTRLCKALVDYYGKLRGIRVFEWHVRHGLHCHMLIDERINVNVVRRLAKPYGFGRIDVKRADLGAGLYLAKYLDKDRGRIPHSGRAWARLGGNGVRVNQVKFESLRGTYLRARIQMLRIEGFTPFKAMQIARDEFETGWYQPALNRMGGLDLIGPEVDNIATEGNPF